MRELRDPSKHILELDLYIKHNDDYLNCFCLRNATRYTLDLSYTHPQSNINSLTLHR